MPDVTPEPVAPETPTPMRTRLLKVPGGEPDLDASLKAAIATAPDEPVKLRLQPDLYMQDERRNYWPWLGVKWMLELTPDDAVAFRLDLEAFILDWVDAHTQNPDGAR